MPSGWQDLQHPGPSGAADRRGSNTTCRRPATPAMSAFSANGHDSCRRSPTSCRATHSQPARCSTPTVDRHQPGDRRADHARPGLPAHHRRRRRMRRRRRRSSGRDERGAGAAVGCGSAGSARLYGAVMNLPERPMRCRAGAAARRPARLAVRRAEPRGVRRVHLPADHHRRLVRRHRRRGTDAGPTGPSSARRISPACSTAATISTRTAACATCSGTAIWNTAEVRRAPGRR